MKENNKLNWFLVAIITALMVFNQYTLVWARSHGNMVTMHTKLDDVDLMSIKSTGHSIAAVFPVENIETMQDAVQIMVPQGTPDYGESIDVIYDNPVKSLANLRNLYYTVELTPEEHQRYLSLVTKPLGISCEFCCGVAAIAVDANGRSICGCQHNPALLGLTKFLIKYSEYNDAEILREVLKWKTLFFPRDMVNLALTVAGGDTSKLDNLLGMVGGC